MEGLESAGDEINARKNEAYVEKRSLIPHDLQKQCNNFFTSGDTATNTALIQKSSRPQTVPKPITRPGGASTTTSAGSNFFQKFAQDTLPAAAANI
jgi:hypothetical protein